MRFQLVPLCAAALLLVGCAGVKTGADRDTGKEAVDNGRVLPPAPAGEQDRGPSPAEIPPDLGQIPEATPQAEARSRYGNPESYEVFGKRYVVTERPYGHREQGRASWYGKKFHGRRTSSGERYDMFAMTAAHKTLPLPAFVRVTNVANGKSVVVRVNDRGPFHPGRVIDLSYAAAHRIGIVQQGSGEVEVEVIDPSAHQLAHAEQLADTSDPLPEPPQAAIAKERPPSSPSQIAAASTATAASVGTGTAKFLQAGVFGDAKNAANFRERLQLNGVRPLLMKSEQRAERWIYRILIGPFPDAATLDSMRRRMLAADTPAVPVAD